jgi:hypothetical protein
MPFDWLVTGGIISVNPTHAVRGPRHSVTKGKTLVLTSEETRQLLDSIPASRAVGKDADGNDIQVPDLMGLRSRALIAAMIWTFARMGAVAGLVAFVKYLPGQMDGSVTLCWDEYCIHRARSMKK